MSVQVSESLGPDGHIKNMTADIRGVPRSTLDELAGGGLVEVVGGYDDSVGDGAVDVATGTIFLGNLDLAYNARRGGSNVLHMEASYSPPRLAELYSPILIKAETATLGGVVERLARAAGFRAEVSAASIGLNAAIPANRSKVLIGHDYSPTQPAMKEIEWLTREISDRTGHQHQAVFTHDTDGALVRIIDLLAPQVETIQIDIESPFVRNASPVITRSATEGYEGDLQETQRDALEVEADNLAFSLDMGLHPAVVAGVVIETLTHAEFEAFTGGSRAPVGAHFIATSVEHTLGDSYGTQASGPFQRSGKVA